MHNHIIKNFDKIAKTPARRKALQIAEAGLEAINTNNVIHRNIKLHGKILHIQDLKLDLHYYNNIYVVSFGKAACDAILAINEILGSRITQGIAVDIKTEKCPNKNIKIFKGTHPTPTNVNVEAAQEIIKLSQDISEKDLVICVVSGGGSSLLVGSKQEVLDGKLIYDEFLHTGGDIIEMNTLRKHASILKAGGLAKQFYPAKIIGLIFSDIPGSKIQDVASGPTFKDESTLKDVESLLKKYKLDLDKKIQFHETPKEEKYFDNVKNILLVSNHTAIEAMHAKATDLNFKVEIYSEKTYEKTNTLAKKLNENLKPNTVRLCAGEPSVTSYKGTFGKGGRNQQLALESMEYMSTNQVFISVGSDGVDNSDMAGAIVDSESLDKVKDYQKHQEGLDAYPVFKDLQDHLDTGPTGSNVADLMISLKY